jgi:hypothetical protein
MSTHYHSNDKKAYLTVLLHKQQNGVGFVLREAVVNAKGAVDVVEGKTFFLLFAE